MPIKKITEANKSLAKGDYSARVEINSGDELEELSESFNIASKALGKLDEQRNQLDKSKTEFLSITSHELRSPMTPMKAQLQMLLRDYFLVRKEASPEDIDAIFSVGFRYSKMRISYSFDLTISQLALTNSGGSHEIGMIYNMGQSSQQRVDYNDCFSIFR